MKPDEQDVFFNLIVSGGGEFIYDSGGNLREAGVGATTTDPVQGLTCPAGRSFWNGHGAILLLISDSNDAIFQYFDNGSAVQGGLVAALATAGGTDPVTGGTYIAGSNNINPTFGNFSVAVGSTIKLGAATFTQVGTIDVQQGSGAVSPAIVLWAPEQGQSGHLVMVMQGTSPDGTHLGQLLVAAEPTGFTVPTPQTSGMIEVQGRGGSPSDSAIEIIPQAFADNALGMRVSGDTNRRLRLNSAGKLFWGSGSAPQDAFLYRDSAALLAATDLAWDNAATAESWHALTPGNGWSNSGSGPNLQYRRIVVNQEIEIIGDLSSGTVVDGTTIATLPAGYRPTHQQWIAPVFVSGSPTTPVNARISVGTGGALNTQGLAGLAASSRVAFHAFVSLDA